MRNRIIALVMAATFVVAGAACEAQDYTNDYVSDTFSGTPSIGVIRDDTNTPDGCDLSGTPEHEDCPYPNDGVLHVYNSAQYQCVAGDHPVSGAAWDDGTSAHHPTAELVNCWIAEVQDDPNVSGDPASVVCLPNDGNGRVIRDWGEDSDCQTPDGDGNYEVVTSHTNMYRTGFAGSYAKAERTLELVRDWNGLLVTESGSTRTAHCIGGFSDTRVPEAHWLCPS